MNERLHIRLSNCCFSWEILDLFLGIHFCQSFLILTYLTIQSVKKKDN